MLVAPILEKRCSSPTHGPPMEGNMIRGSLQLMHFRQNKLTLLTGVSNLRIEHYPTQFWIAPKSKDASKSSKKGRGGFVMLVLRSMVVSDGLSRCQCDQGH